jgi:NTE family protein
MTSQERIRIGLALGGGAIRGLAHLGVLTVLEREHIPVDCVAGTSVGSLIGAAYCAGLRAHQLRKLAAGIGWRAVARPTLSSQGFVSFARLERWLVDQLGALDFSSLQTPFAAVATDLESGEPVILREGDLAPAVRASCSIPGIITPVRMNGRLLGDGGISDNVPAAAARALGADYVIGVDICSPSIRRRLGPFGFGFAALENLVRRAGGGVDTADCLISPDLAGMSYVRFSKREELIARGEKAAQEQLPLIRAALTLHT